MYQPLACPTMAVNVIMSCNEAVNDMYKIQISAAHNLNYGMNPCIISYTTCITRKTHGKSLFSFYFSESYCGVFGMQNWTVKWNQIPNYFNNS